MEKKENKTRGTFDGLLKQQLLIYARELGEVFQRERSLQTALSQGEEQLKKLVAASIAAQETERQWIAYEVHDRIAQTLATVYQQLRMLESLTRANSSTRKAANRASVLVKEAINEARNIMNDLHPPALDELGLIPLIEEELRRFREDTGVRTDFNADCRMRPSEDVEMVLYRIFHEALINIRRHATGASLVTVAIISLDNVISLRVTDDGPGFDAAAAFKNKHVGGLMSMRRRAEIIGGTFGVISAPGTGTQVVICVSAGISKVAGETGK